MGCPLGGRKKSVTTTRKTIIVAMTIWDSLALLWSLGWMKSRSEGRDRPRGQTVTSNYVGNIIHVPTEHSQKVGMVNPPDFPKTWRKKRVFGLARGVERVAQ